MKLATGTARDSLISFLTTSGDDLQENFRIRQPVRRHGLGGSPDGICRFGSRIDFLVGTAYGAVATGHRHLWVSFVHRTWWPSFVVSLGSDGAERLALVNAGHIEALQTVEVGGRELVLAGGFNNEFMLPALAAIEARGATVVSPQTPGTPFVCDNCPPERPLVYMVFPRSDVNIALGSPFISVADIEKPDSTGVVEVSVREVLHATREIYRLSPDFVPQSVAFSDAHWAVHRDLSAAGKLDHAAQDCAARHEGLTVRLWQLATGWRDVRVSPTFAVSKP